MDFSKKLGHHSVQLTWGIYSHWFPGTKKGGGQQNWTQKLRLEGITLLTERKRKDIRDGEWPKYLLHPSVPYMHPSSPTIKKALNPAGSGD